MPSRLPWGPLRRGRVTRELGENLLESTHDCLLVSGVRDGKEDGPSRWIFVTTTDRGRERERSLRTRYVIEWKISPVLDSTPPPYSISSSSSSSSRCEKEANDNQFSKSPLQRNYRPHPPLPLARPPSLSPLAPAYNPQNLILLSSSTSSSKLLTTKAAHQIRSKHSLSIPPPKPNPTLFRSPVCKKFKPSSHLHPPPSTPSLRTQHSLSTGNDHQTDPSPPSDLGGGASRYTSST